MSSQTTNFLYIPTLYFLFIWQPTNGTIKSDSMTKKLSNWESHNNYLYLPYLILFVNLQIKKAITINAKQQNWTLATLNLNTKIFSKTATTRIKHFSILLFSRKTVLNSKAFLSWCSINNENCCPYIFSIFFIVNSSQNPTKHKIQHETFESLQVTWTVNQLNIWRGTFKFKIGFTMKFYVILFIFVTIPTFGLILNDNNVEFKNYVLTSTLISNNASNSTRIKRSKSACHYLALNINKNLYELCILKSGKLLDSMTKNVTVIIHQKDIEKTLKLCQLNIIFASGYIVNKPYSSSLTGYIENERFFGKIRIDFKCFYVEKVNKFPALLLKHNLTENTEDAIVFENNFQSNIKNVMHFLTKQLLGSFQEKIASNKASAKNIHRKTGITK